MWSLKWQTTSDIIYAIQEVRMSEKKMENREKGIIQHFFIVFHSHNKHHRLLFFISIQYQRKSWKVFVRQSWAEYSFRQPTHEKTTEVLKTISPERKIGGKEHAALIPLLHKTSSGGWRNQQEEEGMSWTPWMLGQQTLICKNGLFQKLCRVGTITIVTSSLYCSERHKKMQLFRSKLTF